MRLRRGSRVKSIAIGAAPAFVGVIEEVHIVERKTALAPKGAKYFHVKDQHGVLWHRDPSDLQHLPRR